ncbi:glycosyltransferase [Belliella marina]|uniref:Glycosyltransferase n=1 Tax=Belliella marina TaxID=1644146 RepID=A0ABW4VSQ3_9BACT
MRIAVITMQFPVPSETFASLEINALNELGVETDVYAMRFKHRDFTSLIKERRHKENKIQHLSLKNIFLGIKSMILHPLGFILIFSKILKCLWRNPVHLVKSVILLPSTFYVFQRIKDSNVKVVHLYWGHYPSLCSVLLYKYRKDIAITTFLGANDLEMKYAFSNYSLKISKYIFTISKTNINQILELGGEQNKINVIYHGTIVDDSKLYPKKLINLNEINLVTASRLIPEKGVDKVITILKLLKNKGFNVNLIVAGDGIERNFLIQQSEKLKVKDCVNFIGHVSQDELFKYLDTCNFFILMSSHKGERLPNVVKEAMLKGVIPFTTPTQGIDELVNDKANGWIVNSAEEVVELIVKLMNSPEIYEEMSKLAINKIVSEFDVKKNVLKYKQRWNSLLN